MKHQHAEQHPGVAIHEDYSRVEEISRSSDRSFGLVMAAFFALLWLAPLVSRRHPRWWSLGIAVVFLAVSIAIPQVLTPLNRLWTGLGQMMHRVVNPIVMGVLFFITVTPMGLLMRAFGRDPLRLKIERDAITYWIPRHPAGPSPDSMKNQF